MAVPASPRPDMPAPQPVDAAKVSVMHRSGTRTGSLLGGGTGETGDRFFKFAMMLCGCAVLAMLVLIVYELVLRSSLSWHAFGIKFFGGRDLGPVNEEFGALA